MPETKSILMYITFSVVLVFNQIFDLHIGLYLQFKNVLRYNDLNLDLSIFSVYGSGARSVLIWCVWHGHCDSPKIIYWLNDQRIVTERRVEQDFFREGIYIHYLRFVPNILCRWFTWYFTWTICTYMYTIQNWL